MSTPTQVRRPWRATARTIFAGIVAFAALLPFVVDASGLEPEVYLWLAGSMTHHGEHPALIDTELLEEPQLLVDVMVVSTHS